jgi:DNA replication protein DnaC
MTEQQLIDQDAAFMQAAVTWLKALMVLPAPAMSSALVVQSEPVVNNAKDRSWLPRRAKTEPQPQNVIELPGPSVTDQQHVRQVRQALEQAMAAEPASRFVRFCDVFQLQPSERDVLLLCLCHAVNTEIARLCAAMPESSAGCPSFALALGLAEDPSWDALSSEEQAQTPRRGAIPEWSMLAPDRPLRYWRMIEISQPGAQPLVSSPLRADERIVNHLMGRDYLDDRIAALCQPIDFDPQHNALSLSQSQQISAAIERLHALAEQRGQLLVQMPGSDTASKRLYANGIADAFDLALYQISIEQLNQPNTLDTFVRLWNRERHLQRLALYIDASEGNSESNALLSRLMNMLGGVIFLDLPEPLSNLPTALLLEAKRPSPAEQTELWQTLLADQAGDWPERLAGQFNLNLSEFREALLLAQADHSEQSELGARIWSACRRRARPRLDGLARRISSRTRLADVQVPESEKRLLEQIRDQARYRNTVYDQYGFREHLNRGLGITALLAGESGTGKTMAAEALANELKLDLYRIDLASVVSKYIGETEKNLKRIFDAAEQSGAVLLFDEADAIFGKRSEVKDSHDRYANIEVGYLLQRMEAYEGLAILTSNMKQALDQAFLRRIRFIVQFSFPGAEQREQIWRQIFPAGVRGLDCLDYRKLARPNLTGGQIRNIALNAAFLAAARDGMISHELLREAARDELRKNGKPFSASDFASWETPETG